ncbi:MAG: ankyrin repeat domain-containing protein [Sphingobacteriia bacterium]|nr:ankyrin repeat domain-containing protein [Sphingobacteriia bacterium]
MDDINKKLKEQISYRDNNNKLDIDLVKQLIKKGADVNLKNEYYDETVLHKAVLEGDIKFIQFLLSMDANINAKNNYGETPSDYIRKASHKPSLNVEILKALLGYNDNTENPEYNHILSNLLCKGIYEREKLEDIEFYLKSGADPNFISKESHLRKNLIEIVIEKENEIINECKLHDEQFIRENYVYGRNKDYTPNLIKLLIDNGFNVNQLTNHSECSPLHLTINYLEVVKLLLEKGANINIQDKYGDTPIHAAAALGNIEIIKFLYENGAKVNATNYDNETPLALAIKNHCKYDNSDIKYYYKNYDLYKATVIEPIKFLIEHGCDPYLPNKDGFSPILLSKIYGRLDLVDLLDYNSKDKYSLIYEVNDYSLENMNNHHSFDIPDDSQSNYIN